MPETALNAKAPILRFFRNPVAEDDHRAHSELPVKVRDVIGLDAARQVLQPQYMLQFAQRLHVFRELGGALAQGQLGVVRHKLQEFSPRPARHGLECDGPVATLRQPTLDRVGFVERAGDENLFGDLVCLLIILLDERGEQLGASGLFRNFDKKALTADELAAPHEEDLNARCALFERIADQIALGGARRQLSLPGKELF
jgi:hypothetical protein